MTCINIKNIVDVLQSYVGIDWKKYVENMPHNSASHSEIHIYNLINDRFRIIVSIYNKNQKNCTK